MGLVVHCVIAQPLSEVSDDKKPVDLASGQ
jgi:hypothetical protein